MKKFIVLTLFAALALPVSAEAVFENSRPMGCYDSMTIQRVSGTVYVTEDKNTTYKDITGVDRAGGALAALYESDQPMSEKLKTQGLCEIYDYFPKF